MAVGVEMRSDVLYGDGSEGMCVFLCGHDVV